MKTLLLLAVIILFSTDMFPQGIFIFKKDGSGTTSILINNIDSITFYGLPCNGIPTITYDGKVYNTVRIGSQCWLKENLDVGTQVIGTVNQTNNSVIEKYCYNDDPANCTIYGGLYQWNETMQYVTTAGAQGICPLGWHIPTYTEYQALDTTVNNNGNALLEVGQGGGTNTTGFSSLLAGYRSISGGFFYMGGYIPIWSSTQYDATYAYHMSLSYYDSNFSFSNVSKNYGFSVRCLKN